MKEQHVRLTNWLHVNISVVLLDHCAAFANCHLL